jgi:tetratricopeptide (TPR) repeat protein
MKFVRINPVLIGLAIGAAPPAQAQDQPILTSQQEFERVEATGRAALNAGHYADALLIAQDALTFARREFGASSLLAMRALNDLAVVRQFRGEREAALPLALEAAGGLERLAGPDDPETLNALANLAQLYVQLDRRSDAEALLRRVFTARERTLGAAHESTLQALLELAVFLSHQHRLSEISARLQQAAAAARTALGAENETARDLADAARAARGDPPVRAGS